MGELGCLALCSPLLFAAAYSVQSAKLDKVGGDDCFRRCVLCLSIR
jgi:hypothetical protein